MTTNTQREFWALSDTEQEWQTLKVSHPDYTDVGAAGAVTYRRVQLEAKPFATPYSEMPHAR